MTRINCVPVKELTRQHLVAEYRELPRVFDLVRRRVEKGQHPCDVSIPSSYRLGAGHVTFFFDKLQWLCERHSKLVNEMKKRGYEVNYPEPPSHGIPSIWFGNWIPTTESITKSRQRIEERINSAGS